MNNLLDTSSRPSASASPVRAALDSARDSLNRAAVQARPVLEHAGVTARQTATRMSGRAWVMESLAAGVLSTAVLMLVGRRDTGSAYAPLNAPSQWLWGDEALRRNRADLKHTGVGQLLHHASAFFWGALFEALQARRTRHSVGATLADAALATSVAAVVDLKLVPDRLTPGFEKRLSSSGTAWVYGGLAVGLALGGLAARRRRS